MTTQKTTDNNNMTTWTFENGVIVTEVEYDNDLHEFVVMVGDKRATVTPGDLEEMEMCRKHLDNGEDPISWGWEDGRGNMVENELR